MDHSQPPSGGQRTRAYRRREKSYKTYERKTPLDNREKAAILRFLLIHTKWRKGGRPITLLQVSVIRIVLYHFLNTRTGRCDPAQETVARIVGCDTDTVREAMQNADKLGVMTWMHRWVRGIVNGKRQPLRTSNGYTFTVPAAQPVQSETVYRLAHHHKPTKVAEPSVRELSSSFRRAPSMPTDNPDWFHNRVAEAVAKRRSAFGAA